MSAIEEILGARWLGKKIYYQEETDSTNMEAKRLAKQGAPNGSVVLADQQYEGRGRLGRQWDSPSGAGLWFTLLLRPEILPEKASMVTLVAAMAVVKAMEETQGYLPGIKWPNDIVISGKKVCGILTEMEVKDGKIDYIIVGIGINVLQKEFSPDLGEKATSLFLERPESSDEERELEEHPGISIPSRTGLLQAVLREFELYYDKFLKTSDISLFQQEYENCLINKDQTVKVLDPAGEYEGIARGVNQMGELLVECGKKTTTVRAGEVSVRGVYGYV